MSFLNFFSESEKRGPLSQVASSGNKPFWIGAALDRSGCNDKPHYYWRVRHYRVYGAYLSTCIRVRSLFQAFD